MDSKKKKGKKGKKGAKVKKEEEKVEETEYDNMDLEMLQEVVPMLKQQLEKSMLDRNYVQLERDTIQTFYDICRKEAQNLSMRIAAKDRQMELMEDNHMIEVRVYLQKVKHLEYEHKNNTEHVEEEGSQLQATEDGDNLANQEELRRAKRVFKNVLADREATNAEDIMQVKDAHAKNLTKMREGFETSLQALRDRCEHSLVQLSMDLELRRKVDIHEIEERKNLHINDLMKNHENAFGQMKAYYIDITNDNLKLIRSLKEELTEMKKKAVANQKLNLDISQENKKLSDPLLEAVAQVAEMRTKLKDQEKNRISLANARARLRVHEEQLAELRESYAELEAKFSEVERERDSMYNAFESAIKGVQQKSDFRNLILERKAEMLEQNVEKSKVQLEEVVRAADLDPNQVEQVVSSLDEVLSAKNKGIQDLLYDVVRASKSYNDTLRTYEQKLAAVGVPQHEIEALGFVPVSTATARGPAGLVVQ